MAKAGFVPLDSQKCKEFKYVVLGNISNYLKKQKPVWRTRYNKLIQTPQLWLSEIEWNKVKKDGGLWLLEAAIEGFTANFATHYLAGVPFTIPTILAHGFAIKQGLNIYWRLKQNGANTTVSEAYKRSSE